MLLIRKAIWSLRHEGVKTFLFKTKKWLKMHSVDTGLNRNAMKDVLFINGCALPHPERYRVDHQVEQLTACGLMVDKIFITDLKPDLLKFYRAFVIFRCPINPSLKNFIADAKYFNKRVFFDIDDLVVSREYTDKIPYIQNMKPREKWGYDTGVMQMEETLQCCDYLITSTAGMKKGLEKYGKEIYVNRNVASEKMVELSLKATKEAKKDKSKITIGYLSGSITHNSDMELIKPAIIQILKEYDNVELLIVGILDIPKELQQFSGRIKTMPFGDWTKLPRIIATLDINLAPLTQSVFNEAKSENKWTEAALCKVVTIASDLGAFREAIKNKKTGILCRDDDWYEKIKWLIDNPNQRQKIAENAFEVVMSKYITTHTGRGLADFIESKLAPSFGFVLPSTDVSGGIMVAIKHCHILRESGCDITILNMDRNNKNIKDQDGEVNVVSFVDHQILTHFTSLVATMYTTLEFVKQYPDVKRRQYLVQGKETDFYKYGHKLRSVANATYNETYSGVEYLTISEWCQNWLEKDYGKKAKFAPNGIDLEKFKYHKRVFNDRRKIKVLIEGDSGSYYKNVDESFKIANKLDKDKYEILYLSYQAGAKQWYRIDKFYHKIPHDKVGKIYAEADILIKSSMLESFSYPPLEMMATGGYVVAAPNGGNVGYLRHEENCLMYEQGNIDEAIAQIERISKDTALRNKLEQGGLATASERSWNRIEQQVIELYDIKIDKKNVISKRLELGNNSPISFCDDVNDRKEIIQKALSDKKSIAVFFVDNKFDAQFRYRCYNTLESTMQSQKWQSVYFTKNETEELEEVIPLCKILIIERQCAKNGYVYELVKKCHTYGITVAYDVDDLVFDMRYIPLLMRSTKSLNLPYWIAYVGGVRKIAKKADCILTTNRFLGKKAKDSLKKPYAIIPNSLNSYQVQASEKFCKQKQKEGIFRVGYFSGTLTHAKDFQLVMHDLKRFLDAHDDTVIEIVGYMDFGKETKNMLEDGRIRFLPPVDFVELQKKMSEVDVNIAPLLNNDFTNCKSELKFFEAAAVATTTIASPIYSFKQSIIDGENGFLARPSEWYKKLEYLYSHPNENRKIALNAKKYCLSNYYGEEFLKKVEEAFDSLAK